MTALAKIELSGATCNRWMCKEYGGQPALDILVLALANPTLQSVFSTLKGMGNNKLLNVKRSKNKYFRVTSASVVWTKCHAGLHYALERGLVCAEPRNSKFHELSPSGE